MKTGNKIIASSIVLGLFAWLLDAATDYFFYRRGTSFSGALLFDLPGHEIYMRSIIVSLFVLFGMAISKVVAKRASAEEELKKHREHLTALVNERTNELVSANVSLQEEIAGRKKVEMSLRESKRYLRYLSSKILNAQEAERRRISRELHDELGQALTLMKLQIRSVEKGLDEEQSGLREDCESILHYTDQIIENVRRLSRDLSPSVLEDLGLSAAVRWMINNFEKNYGISVKANISEIDHMFPADDQIIIYRIMQEAFTNIGKHSKAENVYAVVRRQGDAVSCLVEDDGRGFDIAGMAERNVTEKGLGLSTMRERALMLGSSLDIWSDEGRGTRISMSIPLKREQEMYGTVQYCAGG